MQTKVNTKTEVKTFKFKVPKTFKDPLKVVTSEDSFDEIQCEEWNHYYNIFLNKPVKHEV